MPRYGQLNKQIHSGVYRDATATKSILFYSHFNSSFVGFKMCMELETFVTNCHKCVTGF